MGAVVAEKEGLAADVGGLDPDVRSKVPNASASRLRHRRKPFARSVKRGTGLGVHPLVLRTILRIRSR